MPNFTVTNINYYTFFPYEQFRQDQEAIIKQLENTSKERNKNI